MKFKELRWYLKSKNLSAPHTLKDCDLVVDASSFFQDTYKNSGLQFILGADSDRYADILIKNLSQFLDSNIKCHFIFNGVAKHDLEKTQEIQKRIIDDLVDAAKDYRNATYFPPLFLRDMQKQVLEELDIKYFVCEYDSIEAIVGVARKLKCPVLTNNIEYCLLNVSCIPNSLLFFDETTKSLSCEIHDHEKYKTALSVYNKIPILLTLLNESGCYRDVISEDLDVPVVLKWVKRNREEVILNMLKNIDKDSQTAFKEVYEKMQILYSYPTCHLAVKYFQREKPHGLFRDDKKWFAKGVSNGRIAPPYINLMKKGVICGSQIFNDVDKPDALLAAKNIIAYSHCLLKKSKDSAITFIGRKNDDCKVRDVVTHWDSEVLNIFAKCRSGKVLKLTVNIPDPFEEFINAMLPGLDYKDKLLMISPDCWLVIISLVYYIQKKNKEFVKGAYCVLLSYLMLGPVSEHLTSNVLKEKDYEEFYNGLKFLFVRKFEVELYKSDVIHSFSEFQHCLQHMNYLNKLSGERIPCTVYHNTYNASFIYNTYVYMKDKDCLKSYLETKLIGSSVVKEYKRLVNAFERCLDAVL